MVFFFPAESGIPESVAARGLGGVYKGPPQEARQGCQETVQLECRVAPDLVRGRHSQPVDQRQGVVPTPAGVVEASVAIFVGLMGCGSGGQALGGPVKPNLAAPPPSLPASAAQSDQGSAIPGDGWRHLPLPTATPTERAPAGNTWLFLTAFQNGYVSVVGSWWIPPPSIS